MLEPTQAKGRRRLLFVLQAALLETSVDSLFLLWGGGMTLSAILAVCVSRMAAVKMVDRC